jgi:hypothetical protein
MSGHGYAFDKMVREEAEDEQYREDVRAERKELAMNIVDNRDPPVERDTGAILRRARRHWEQFRVDPPPSNRVVTRGGGSSADLIYDLIKHIEYLSERKA